MYINFLFFLKWANFIVELNRYRVEQKSLRSQGNEKNGKIFTSMTGCDVIIFNKVA